MSKTAHDIKVGAIDSNEFIEGLLVWNIWQILWNHNVFAKICKFPKLEKVNRDDIFELPNVK